VAALLRAYGAHADGMPAQPQRGSGGCRMEQEMGTAGGGDRTLIERNTRTGGEVEVEVAALTSQPH